MDFTRLKRLIIPEGDVKQIKIGGAVVWSKFVGVTAIKNTSLPDGTSWSTNSNISYSSSLSYAGATLTAISDLPVTWSAEGLPSGLSVNANTGVISGTIAKNAAADYTSSVTVTATTTKNSLSKVLSLKVNKYKGPTQINTYSLPNGECKVAYTNTTISCNSTNAVTWSATGLPSGLSINSSTGVVSGTISLENLEDTIYTVTFKAVSGIASVSRDLSLTVKGCSPYFTSSGLTFTNNSGTANMIVRNIDTLNTAQTVTCYRLSSPPSTCNVYVNINGSNPIGVYRRVRTSTGSGSQIGTLGCSVSGDTITVTPSFTKNTSVLVGSNASSYELISPTKGGFTLEVTLRTKTRNELVKTVSIPISFVLY